MSKILNQETRLTAQYRRSVERELEALTETESAYAAELQARQEALELAQVEIDRLKALNGQLQEAADSAPQVVYRERKQGLIETAAGITVFLIAVCVIGVTSLTINTQSILIDNLMSRVDQLRMNQQLSTVVFAPRQPQSAEPIPLDLLYGQNFSDKPIAVSYWENPDDPASGPYSEIARPRTRGEAMQLALARADKR